MNLWFVEPDIEHRLQRPDGLCTSIAMDDRENATRMKAVIDAYLAGVTLEEATRTCDDWHMVLDLPQDFSGTRYRIAR